MTPSNANPPTPEAIDAIRKAVEALCAAPPAAKVIYVRDDHWDQFAADYSATVASTSADHPIHGEGRNIRVEKVDVLPRPWLTGLELDAMAKELASRLPWSADTMLAALLRYGADTERASELAGKGLGWPPPTKKPAGVLLCSRCSERPAVPGSSYCSVCAADFVPRRLP